MMKAALLLTALTAPLVLAQDQQLLQLMGLQGDLVKQSYLALSDYNIGGLQEQFSHLGIVEDFYAWWNKAINDLIVYLIPDIGLPDIYTGTGVFKGNRFAVES